MFGSTQRALADVSERRACGRVEVVRRRSGGGAVLLEPEDPVWVDLWVPRGDSLWESDVTRSALWLGRSWVRALRRVGIEGAQVYSDRFTRSSRGTIADEVCFGSLAPGEVVVSGRKLVGISQWRSREGSLFSCALYLHWDPRAIVSIIAAQDLLEPSLSPGRVMSQARSARDDPRRSGDRPWEISQRDEMKKAATLEAAVGYLSGSAVGLRELTGTPVVRASVEAGLCESLPERASWEFIRAR